MKSLTRWAYVVMLFTISGQLQAGVINFAINQGWTQGGNSTDQPIVTIDLPGTDDFQVDPGFSGRYLDVSFKENGGGGTFSTINTQIDGYYFLRNYSVGEIVGLGNFGDHASPVNDWDSILVNDQTVGGWGASHNGALGFRTDAGQFGYINYSFARVGLLSTLNLRDGSYETISGQNITVVGVAAVPEPSALSIWCIAGLSVGVVARRKKRKSA